VYEKEKVIFLFKLFYTKVKTMFYFLYINTNGAVAWPLLRAQAVAPWPAIPNSATCRGEEEDECGEDDRWVLLLSERTS